MLLYDSYMCCWLLLCVDNLTNEKALVSYQIGITTFESKSLHTLLQNLDSTSTFLGKSSKQLI